MVKKVMLLLLVGLISCTMENPTTFSKEALEDVFITLNKEEVTFDTILTKNKGKKILIDVWASWCIDCLENLPKVKKLQRENPDVVYLFLSLDRDLKSWRNSVERLGIKGQHYYMKSGWEGKFGDFLGLSWIPRYVLINETGGIEVFNATKATDNLIIEGLKK
ncbi:TlpA family protein disulfide reductase [Tenacibaculum aiptasiae]|uniref:TlpA family protein disulfide reductase n=1 Tax=Tenacibaculum aiptasiae TaxID=426481 RepID=UPI00232F0FF0|nr:TlpA disulfide reductase family protein [Tenacibaculum aiptasiae]